MLIGDLRPAVCKPLLVSQTWPWEITPRLWGLLQEPTSGQPQDHLKWLKVLFLLWGPGLSHKGREFWFLVPGPWKVKLSSILLSDGEHQQLLSLNNNHKKMPSKTPSKDFFSLVAGHPDSRQYCEVSLFSFLWKAAGDNLHKENESGVESLANRAVRRHPSSILKQEAMSNQVRVGARSWGFFGNLTWGKGEGLGQWQLCFGSVCGTVISSF
jgi:hypothetical protein